MSNGRVACSFSKERTQKMVEERIVMLETYLRKALHILTMYGCMEKSASKGLQHLQVFLEVDQHINCLYPPLVDDQRAVELLCYIYLNDFSSPACQQCVKFIQVTSSVLEMVKCTQDNLFVLRCHSRWTCTT